MSTSTIDQLDKPTIEPMLRFKMLVRTSREVLRRTIGLNTLPQELQQTVDYVNQLPPVEVDRALQLLVDHTAWPAKIAEHPELLPPSYTQKIAEFATTVAAREPDQLTPQALVALGRAADDTGEHHFLTEALELAKKSPNPNGHRPVLQALEYADTHGVPFRESLIRVRGENPRDIDSPVRISAKDKSFEVNEEPVMQVAMSELDNNLFHPTIRRPNTPEYTEAGIHPSLKPKYTPQIRR